MEPLRIGVLGAARISELAIVKPARTVGARLVAVAARDRSRAEEFAVRHGVERVHASYDELLADPEVEVVYNPLANGLHGPWNLRAIAAGKHVLSEKPFASNAVEGAVVREAALVRGVTVVEAFHYLHHPLFQRVLELLKDDVIGTLRSVETPMRMPAPADDDPRWDLGLAGGSTMDLGCYSIHAVRMIGQRYGGPPTLVAAKAGERAGHPGVDEWLTAEYVYPSGATAVAGSHMAADAWDFSLTVVGSRGQLRVENFVQPHVNDRLTVTTTEGERVEHLGERSSYTFQLEALTAHLRQGALFPLDLDDAVAQMEAIDAAYELAGLPPRPTLKL
ncbi:MAG TPA: Gfo/Idh/MocA family oxidoreductase [Segeticoccus sp.]|uniref:Gfo/Idh/MocA family protein n=1 Tax=Segeticoccus sp. TaxID=2706531 RepID=UPI002D7EF6C9|nr:Gfo/Idh/MocA family oxidoreductase [Segeticoccus sp.]HET8602063.1 Gfo/Idh/MocA family oxidoreductase [Segeticoccus sp.]